MGIKGPLPEGIVGLILGRSFLSIQGLSVIPLVTDSDYEEEIKVMIDTSTKTHFITKGQRIAQLLLLPYYSLGKTVTSALRGEGGFASSDMAFWLQDITSNRPMKQLIVEGIAIEGLLDT